MSIEVKSPPNGFADSVGGSPNVQESSNEDQPHARRPGAKTGLAQMSFLDRMAELKSDMNKYETQEVDSLLKRA
jgi:hypothetical protein